MTFLALALFAAAQAPAIEAEARCIVYGFTSGERERIVELIRRAGEPDPALQGRLQQVGIDCVASRGWAEPQAGAFIAYALGSMLRDDTGLKLRRAGVDPAWLETWLARQDERVRTTPAIAEADSERLVLDLQAQGIPIGTIQSQSELIGAYVSALAIMERARRGLPFE